MCINIFIYECINIYSVLVIMHMSAYIYLCICSYTRPYFLAMSPDSSVFYCILFWPIWQEPPKDLYFSAEETERIGDGEIYKEWSEVKLWLGLILWDINLFSIKTKSKRKPILIFMQIREAHIRNAYFKYCINFDNNATSLCK